MEASRRLKLIAPVFLSLLAWPPQAAWPRARIDCGACRDTRKVTCDACRGAGRFCPGCQGEKIRCQDCGGTARLACTPCDSKRAFACTACGGAGRSWVPQRKSWVRNQKSGKAGIRYEPAHWEKCGRCDGRGQVACGDCGGRGSTRCSACEGKGSLTCVTCRGKARERPECARCEGRGRLSCKVCEDREADPGASPGPPGGPELALLHAALADIRASPPLKPLLAVARVGATRNPWGIVVLRAALRARHAWVRMLALDELEGFGANDLALIGGPDLATRLIGLAGGTSEAAGRAQSLLLRLASEYPLALYQSSDEGGWRIERARFPEGQDLPPLPPGMDPANPGAAASGSQPADPPRGRTGVAPAPQSPPAEEEGQRFGSESPGLPSFDLVWAIDCSGSMQRRFKQAITIVDRTNQLLCELLGAQRVGLVGYRDRVETKLEVTDDPDRMRAALSRLRAARGGAPEEGVDIALQAAFHRAGMGLEAGPAVVVVVGDSGPAPERVPALLAGLRAFRAVDGKRKLHALVVPSGGGVNRFWIDLAREGGGQVLPFDERSSVESLCLALLDGLDRAALVRVLRAVAGK